MEKCTLPTDTKKPVKNVYIAGPMSGVPYFNFPTFFKAERVLSKLGYNCFNPARHDINTYGPDIAFIKSGSMEEATEVLGANAPNYKDCLRVDLNWILDRADAIALLSGWENSKGAKVEKALADALGLEVISL